MTKPGNRYVAQHHHRGKSPSPESNEKRRQTQLGRKRSEKHKKTRAAHKENCQCFCCRNKRGELKGDNCPNYGRRHTEDHKRKVSKVLRSRGGHRFDCLCPFCKAKKGQHPNWHGGISREGYPCRFNEKLKEDVRKRDGNICQVCNKTREENGRKLDVHHIDYDKENVAMNNLVSLCRSCNVKVNKDREHWSNYFLLRWILVA